MKHWFVIAGLILAASSGAEAQLLNCRTAARPDDCNQARAQLEREDRAFRGGDYTAMRNRAFCLWDGCDGSMSIDRAASCAIRRLIMRRHANSADRGDEANLVMCHQAGY